MFVNLRPFMKLDRRTFVSLLGSEKNLRSKTLALLSIDLCAVQEDTTELQLRFIRHFCSNTCTKCGENTAKEKLYDP